MSVFVPHFYGTIQVQHADNITYAIKVRTSFITINQNYLLSKPNGEMNNNEFISILIKNTQK